MSRLPTGLPDLDPLIGGGLPLGSLVVIAGPPGTGKTILAQQICFANANEEHRAIYYTTLSEPHLKLIRHLEGFTFFDKTKLGRTVEFNHLSGVAGGGFGPVSAEIVRRSFEVQPSVIVVDSARALHDAGAKEAFREAVYDLASRVAHTDAVLIFVGEYTYDDIADAPEFAVADAIVFLSNEPEGPVDRRSLHVLKLRGSDYVSGLHALGIDAGGVRVFPRFEASVPEAVPLEERRVSTGIGELDTMMGGGLPAGSATLVGGPSGVGKTVLGIHFVAEGLARGERCLYLSFQESDRQLAAKARGLGMDVSRAMSSGALAVLYVHPVELGIDAVGARLREAIFGSGVQRVVVDSISELEQAAKRTERYADFLWALVEVLRAAGTTSILTNETRAFFGPAFELAGGHSYVFDNVILLRYTELQSEIRRALTVVKMRESEHVKTLVEFDIGRKGIAVKGAFAGLSGVLTGTPVRTEERFREFFER